MADRIDVLEAYESVEVLSLAAHEADSEVYASYFSALTRAKALLVTQSICGLHQLLAQKCLGILGATKHRSDALPFPCIILGSVDCSHRIWLLGTIEDERLPEQ